MKLRFGDKALITQEYYDWYHTDTPDNSPEGRPDYFKLGEIVIITNPQLWYKQMQGHIVRDNERLVITADERALTIIPLDVLEKMRNAYLARKREK